MRLRSKTQRLSQLHPLAAHRQSLRPCRIVHLINRIPRHLMQTRRTSSLRRLTMQRLPRSQNEHMTRRQQTRSILNGMPGLIRPIKSDKHRSSHSTLL